MEILSEQIVYQKGSYRRIRRWLRGIHIELGVIVHGITGLETLVEIDVIVPIKIYLVLPENIA